MVSIPGARLHFSRFIYALFLVLVIVAPIVGPCGGGTDRDYFVPVGNAHR